ncbi:hypothetical protein CGCVW01_v010380, partial [Colletotrichum viniferum]
DGIAGLTLDSNTPQHCWSPLPSPFRPTKNPEKPTKDLYPPDPQSSRPPSAPSTRHLDRLLRSSLHSSYRHSSSPNKSFVHLLLEYCQCKNSCSPTSLPDFLSIHILILKPPLVRGRSLLRPNRMN